MASSSDEEFDEFWVDINEKIQKSKSQHKSTDFNKNQKLEKQIDEKIPQKQSEILDRIDKDLNFNMKLDIQLEEDFNEQKSQLIQNKNQNQFTNDKNSFQNLNNFMDCKFEQLQDLNNDVHIISNQKENIIQGQMNQLEKTLSQGNIKQKEIPVFNSEKKKNFKSINQDEENHQQQNISNQRLKQAENEIQQINLLLIEKDTQIANLTRLLSQQEALQNKSNPATPEVSQKSPKLLIERTKEECSHKTLFKEHQEMKNQYQELYQFVSILQDEIEKLKMKLNDEKSNQRKIEKLNEVSLKKQEKQFQRQLEETKERHSKNQFKFEQYIQELKNELNLKNSVLQKQQSTIEELRNELRTAKQILKAPRLRSAIFERLQDYEPYLKNISNTPKSEYALDQHKPSQPKINRPNTIYSRNKHSSSTKNAQIKEQMSVTTQPRTSNLEMASTLTQTIKEMSSHPEVIHNKPRRFRAKKVNLPKSNNKSR